MFGLSITPKENFLAYLTQFVFLTIGRLVPGNVVTVAIDMCGKREWIYGITQNHLYFIKISVHFIVGSTSI